MIKEAIAKVKKQLQQRTTEQSEYINSLSKQVGEIEETVKVEHEKKFIDIIFAAEELSTKVEEKHAEVKEMITTMTEQL